MYIFNRVLYRKNKTTYTIILKHFTVINNNGRLIKIKQRLKPFST